MNTIRKFLKRSRFISELYKKTYRVVLSNFTKISPLYASKYLYRKTFGKKLNLQNPKTLNEKLMWLKLYYYNDNSLVTKCIDKAKLKTYICEKGYKSICNNLVGKGVYDNVNDICWSELPNEFVIKCNHGSGYNIICRNKQELDVEKTIKLLEKWIKEDYYLFYAEIQYKNIKKKIVIEKYLGDQIKEYKFFCFNGSPKFLFTTPNLGQKVDLSVDFFDLSWNRLPFKRIDYPISKNEILPPSNFEEMINIAKDLSQGFPFVRVDFMTVDDKIYISELTFIPTAALMQFEPCKVDEELGEYLSIETLIESYKLKNI